MSGAAGEPGGGRAEPPAEDPAPAAGPDPKRPGDVRWQQVVGGWFLALACVAVPLVTTAAVAGIADLLGVQHDAEPLLLVAGVGGPLATYAAAFAVTAGARRKGLAVGIALFGATLVLLSAACFVLVFANFPY